MHFTELNSVCCDIINTYVQDINTTTMTQMQKQKQKIPGNLAKNNKTLFI